MKRGKPSSENNTSEHGVARAVQHFKTKNLKASNDICLRKLLVSMISRGAPVGTSIIISVGHGIMLKCDRSSLEEFGDTVQLNKEWSKSVLRRMGITKRRANSKAKILPGTIIEIKEQYLMGIRYCSFSLSLCHT